MFPDRQSDDVVTEFLQAYERVPRQIKLGRQFTEINCQMSALSSLLREQADRVSNSNVSSEKLMPNSREETGVDNPF